MAIEAPGKSTTPQLQAIAPGPVQAEFQQNAPVVQQKENVAPENAVIPFQANLEDQPNFDPNFDLLTLLTDADHEELMAMSKLKLLQKVKILQAHRNSRS